MKASVVIPAWNGSRFLGPCLDAVLAQEGCEIEVLVVDDGSTDGSAALVAGGYPHVRLIRNPRHLYFAGSCNRGLSAACGSVFVLLNQDTVVQPGWLLGLLDALHGSHSTGIVGGKALYPDGTIQHAGGHVDERGEGGHYGHREPDSARHDRLRPVAFVTGASLAIARATFEAVGGLDEGFAPAYYEDVDWCYRARAAGYEVVYAPGARLLHYEQSALAGDSQESMYHYHRNRLRFVLKHWPATRLLDEFTPAEKTWLESLGEGGEQLVAAMYRAYFYWLLHLSELLAWRQQLFGSCEGDADACARALVTLRSVVPLRPALLAADLSPDRNPPVLDAEGRHVEQ